MLNRALPMAIVAMLNTKRAESANDSAAKSDLCVCVCGDKGAMGGKPQRGRGGGSVKRQKISMIKKKHRVHPGRTRRLGKITMC